MKETYRHVNGNMECLRRWVISFSSTRFGVISKSLRRGGYCGTGRITSPRPRRHVSQHACAALVFGKVSSSVLSRDVILGSAFSRDSWSSAPRSRVTSGSS